MHHGTCVTHVPWCMSGSLTCGDGENVPGIPGACAPANLRIWQEAHAAHINPGTCFDNSSIQLHPITYIILMLQIFCSTTLALFSKAPMPEFEFSINTLRPSDAYMRHYTRPSLVQMMACRLFGAKPSSEPMMIYCHLDHRFHPRKCIWKHCLRNGGHSVSASVC